MLRGTNSPPVDDTERRPGERESSGDNHNTSRQALLELIPTGEENGIGAGELARLLGVSDSRTIRQMVAAAKDRGLWTPGSGKTPEQTLYSAIMREIRDKGDASRFEKDARGHFKARV